MLLGQCVHTKGMINIVISGYFTDKVYNKQREQTLQELGHNQDEDDLLEVVQILPVPFHTREAEALSYF